MTKGDSRARKSACFERLSTIFTEYSKIFVVNVDNVGSNQMHQIRAACRGQAEIAMGKNTMVRRVLKNLIPDHPKLEALLPHVIGNVGFVFTNGDLKEVRDVLVSNTVGAPAKAGVMAPCDVKIPAGSTGMDPGKTQFFQALGIPTKITRGLIEIMSEVHLVVKDTKVSPSQSALLTMMKVMPFTYGMTVTQIFDDGNVFPSSVLDITDEQLFESFAGSLKTVAALSLAINLPTLAAVPHVMVNAYKNILSVAVETDFTFPLAEKVKAYLADPSAFAVAAPAAGAAADAPAAAAPVEEEEESDDDMGFGLFD